MSQESTVYHNDEEFNDETDPLIFFSAMVFSTSPTPSDNRMIVIQREERMMVVQRKETVKNIF